MTPARLATDRAPEHHDQGWGRQADRRGAGGGVSSGTRTCRRRTRCTSRTRSRCCTRSAGGSCTTTTSGRRERTRPVTGSIDSIEGQYSFSLGQLFHYPQAFWGDGPDLIATMFGMYNHVHGAGDVNRATRTRTAAHINKLKFGAECTYVPLPWLGVGGGSTRCSRTWTTARSRSRSSRRGSIFRTAFVTHEQIMLQYSRTSDVRSAFQPGRVAGRVAVPVQLAAGGSRAGGGQERRADRGDHLVLGNDDLSHARKTHEDRIEDGCASDHLGHRGRIAVGAGLLDPGAVGAERVAGLGGVDSAAARRPRPRAPRRWRSRTAARTR